LKADAQLHADLAVEGFRHASQTERALEEILAERFRVAFRCKPSPRRALPAPPGAQGVVANEARSAMLVKLDYEAAHPPAESVEVSPGLVSAALRVFAGNRVRFLKLTSDMDAPLVIQQEHSRFAVLIAPLMQGEGEA
jgi:hypothetical protein